MIVSVRNETSFFSAVTERSTDPISVACFDQFTLFSDLNQSFELHVRVHTLSQAKNSRTFQGLSRTLTRNFKDFF